MRNQITRDALRAYLDDDLIASLTDDDLLTIASVSQHIKRHSRVINTIPEAIAMAVEVVVRDKFSWWKRR